MTSKKPRTAVRIRKPSPRAKPAQLLLEILERSGDAILALDPRHRIISWNAGAERLFGYRADEVLGKHFKFLVPEDLLERDEIAHIVRLTEKTGSLLEYETRRVTKDGREIHVAVTRTRLLGRNGRSLGAAAIVRDITHRKELEQQLIVANTLAAIGEFASRIAHEIKNPLAGISGAINVLADSFADADERRGVVREIDKEIQRLDHTVNDLLNFARPRRPQLQPVNLVQLVDHVLTVLREEPSLKAIPVERRFGKAEVVVQADPALLEDAFINLIINAAQALERQRDGRLIITIGTRERGAMVTFTDNGPGVPKEIRAKIFDPFFTTKTRGTGLGLPITRKNIEAHGGALGLSSRPHKGTNFTVFLPWDGHQGSTFAVGRGGMFP
ncbi:MAG: PAS domain S-box protein [Planctomycetota bacterium]